MKAKKYPKKYICLRTTSEGNHMEIHRRRAAAAGSSGVGGSSSKSSSGMFSGSPMSPSPGSYVSSESAGSSNSLDEAEFGPERRHSEEKNIYFLSANQ